MLTELTALPEGLLELTSDRLHERLQGPTLIHLPGRHSEPLFVSVLLHGNEYTGWDAIRSLLRRYQTQELPRALSFFIGNVSAARAGVRHLSEQLDFNRIWQGEGSDAHAMARSVVEIMRDRNVFASIDIHNNTGLNPHYACVNKLDKDFLHLATLFSRTIVYFIKPDTVQSMAFSELCPAVTVECGKAGVTAGVEQAMAFIDAALHLGQMPAQPPSPHDYDLFHTVATVKVPSDVDFSFSRQDADLFFPAEIDHMNFHELAERTRLATTNHPDARLEAWSEEGEDVAQFYFERRGDGLYTRVPVMPSMLTQNEEVIRQDCLCYLMERLPTK